MWNFGGKLLFFVAIIKTPKAFVGLSGCVSQWVGCGMSIKNSYSVYPQAIGRCLGTPEYERMSCRLFPASCQAIKAMSLRTDVQRRLARLLLFASAMYGDRSTDGSKVYFPPVISCKDKLRKSMS